MGMCSDATPLGLESGDFDFTGAQGRGFAKKSRGKAQKMGVFERGVLRGCAVAGRTVTDRRMVDGDSHPEAGRIRRE